MPVLWEVRLWLRFCKKLTLSFYIIAHPPGLSAMNFSKQCSKFSSVCVNYFYSKWAKKEGQHYTIPKSVKCLAIDVPLQLIFDSLRCGCLGSSVVRAPFTRLGCCGFESRSGHLIFSSICSVYLDRHIRVDLSDDEQYVRNMPCYM